MKHARLALALTVTVLSTTPAIAASLTMLQFGSFETREEAEKRLSEVMKKHAAHVGGLQAAVREVKLPPDNLTVYRTQAGPVENRAAAQSICSQLASAGDECYIVQTAMLPATAASAPIAAATKPAVPTLAPASSVAIPPVAASKPDMPAAVAVAEKPAPQLIAIPEVDRSSATGRFALHTADSGAVEPLPVQPAMSDAMHTALDKAAQDQESVANTIDAATMKVEENRPSRSFWSRLNPFEDGEEPKKLAENLPPSELPDPAIADTVAAVPAPAVDVAPASPPVELAPMPPVAAPEPMVAEMPAPMSALPQVAPPALLPPPVVVAPEPAQPMVALDTTPIIFEAEPMQLPPPPEPLTPQARTQLMASPSPLQEPVSTGVLPLMGGADAMVSVEEARRVPLSDGAMLPPPPSAIEAKPLPPQVPMVPLLPATTKGKKTVWAQIGPFASGDAALAFWGHYRMTHPDFPVVRVRVTSAYQYKLKGVDQTWLRVGPVMDPGFVKGLCSSLPEDTQLRCGHVVDMGVSGAAAKFVPDSRYQR